MCPIPKFFLYVILIIGSKQKEIGHYNCYLQHITKGQISIIQKKKGQISHK